MQVKQEIGSYIDQHFDRFLQELLQWLKIPSVSADSTYKADTRKAAEWVADQLKAAGADDVKLYDTKGHPIVFGQKMVDASLPTVLVYGHYDVQPPDPLDLWHSPPFEPVIKNTSIHPKGAIYARGACDDKGQAYMHVKAFETMMATGDLPCNIKFMIEGEEEVGSVNLGSFCEAYKDMLACDVILISDTSTISLDTPSITVGLRGLSYVEVEVQGPNRDLHSGVFGGAVANPANVLSQMIASMHDDNGYITIPGFYDDVEIVSAEERAAMNQAPFDLTKYKENLEIDDIRGEHGYTVAELTSIRPTLDVNGMWSGYTGEGAKTVLPSKAFAKISMRLVPHQDSHTIGQLFQQYFESIAPVGVKVKVSIHHGGEPYVTPIDSDEYRAAAAAINTSFGVEAIPQRSGGSIPIVALFEKVFGVKSILMGFGYATDDLHSPNEHFGIANFRKGIETIPYFYHHYARIKNG